MHITVSHEYELYAHLKYKQGRRFKRRVDTFYTIYTQRASIQKRIVLRGYL